MTKLNPTDFEDFFIRTYFGQSTGDYIDLSIQRAYLDFNRTLHGISKLNSKDLLYTNAKTYLKTRLIKLSDGVMDPTEENFNNWHKETCDGLIEHYNQYHYQEFYYGHAQKWINMSLKYIFALREVRVPGFSKFTPFFHIPIDNIILKKMKQYHIPVFFDCAWSKMNNYDDYLQFQKWIRKNFQDNIPIELEFLLWLNKI
jgi:hypothetical protein